MFASPWHFSISLEFCVSVTKTKITAFKHRNDSHEVGIPAQLPFLLFLQTVGTCCLEHSRITGRQKKGTQWVSDLCLKYTVYQGRKLAVHGEVDSGEGGGTGGVGGEEELSPIISDKGGHCLTTETISTDMCC